MAVTYCRCSQYMKSGVKEVDGVQICRTCQNPLLPEHLCDCDPLSIIGRKTKLVDGVQFCEKCSKEIYVSESTKDIIARRDKLQDLVIVTTDTIPGYEIEEVFGLVSHLVGSSGFTAGMKGREAKDSSLDVVMNKAVKAGANAIVGVRFSAFGAGGGLTNVFGGDAVGVLVSGTAVRVRRLSPEAIVG